MAPKKPDPMEKPPAASSDEEEEETEEEETSSGEEEEDDDEETPEPTQLSSPPSKQPASKKPESSPAAPAKSSSSEEESGSESESDSEPEPTPKPIATKPMEETTPKATKPRSSKPASKRANETEGTQKDAKRAKKKATDGGGDGEEEEEAAPESKKPGEETKKQLFQRLWSEDDEIAVLKGIIEFSTKKGIDPNQDMNGFHDFIKKSLHVDVSRTQLVDKIRRLRKKYENNLGKGIKKGEDRTFSKPHEQKAYELSKKVWGGEGSNVVVDSAVKSNGKARKVQNQKGNNNTSKQLAAAFKAELDNGPKEVEKMEVDNDNELNLKIVDVEKFLFDRGVGVAGLEDYVIKNGLNIIGGSKKAELKQRWKKLQIAQLELYVERSKLVTEQAMLMLEALKSSDDK